MDKFEMISKMGFDCLRTKECFENNRKIRKDLYKNGRFTYGRGYGNKIL